MGQKVKEMYVNGQKIADEKMADYSAIIQKIDTQIAEDLAQAKLDAEDVEHDAQLDAEEAQRDAEEAQRDANITVQQALEDAEQAELDAATAQQDAQVFKEDRKQAKRDIEQTRSDIQLAKRDAEQARLDIQRAKRDIEQAKLDSQQAKRNAEQAKIDSKDDLVMQKNMESMAAEMVTDQMVSSIKKIDSFWLSDTDFIVNGKKQSEVIHEKYKQKYLSKPGFGIYYGNNGKVTGKGYFYARKKGGL